MRLWKVVVLVDVALAFGFGAGLLWSARDIRQLRDELTAARRAPPAAGDTWTAEGIVRLVQPGSGVVWLTHGDIAGLMQGMTMPFEAASAQLLAGLSPGDRVRFTLKQQGGRLLLVAIEKEGPS